MHYVHAICAATNLNMRRVHSEARVRRPPAHKVEELGRPLGRRVAKEAKDHAPAQRRVLENLHCAQERKDAQTPSSRAQEYRLGRVRCETRKGPGRLHSGQQSDFPQTWSQGVVSVDKTAEAASLKCS
eukprot:2161653-Pleurochrysis_carterae.AAC.2